MLHMITGTPGAGKTLYAVDLIDRQEKKNKIAMDYNAVMHDKNKKIIHDNDLLHYFLTHTYFSKVTKNHETVVFEQHYFDVFLKKERFEDIFLHIHFYNKICDKIRLETEIELKQLKYVRHIYSNIDGLKVDHIRPIIEDWRTAPDGSILFYDEIQLIETYSAGNRKTKEQSDILEHLTVHRHRAFDIYGITQFPRLVHSNFRDVVGLHYHLHRGWGAPSATVYVWANCREKPNSLGNKFTAERSFRFNYPKRLYEIYESSTVDTFKFRIPIKFLAYLLIPLFGIMVLFSTFFAKENFLTDIFGNKSPKPVSSSNVSKPQGAVSVGASEPVTSSQVQQTQDKQQTVVYDPNKPYDVPVQTVQYEVKNKPIFSGCIKYNGKYTAYTEQGTILKDVAQLDCTRLLDKGDRPYDYFGNHAVKQQQEKTVVNDYENIKKVREVEAEQQSKDVYAENLNVKDSRTMLSDQNKFKNYDDTAISSYR